MELYLTISIQLQEYEEVEMTIDTLLEEGIIPQDILKEIQLPRELNTRLSMRYATESPDLSMAPFTFEDFLEMDSLHNNIHLLP